MTEAFRTLRPSCGSCHFAVSNSTGGYQCRINPPIANPNGNPTYPDTLRLWPIVESQHWCGKWDWKGNYA